MKPNRTDPEPTPGCRLCAMTADLPDDRIIGRGHKFTINRNTNPSVRRPWLVLQPSRHVTRWTDLTGTERDLLGWWLPTISAVIENEPAVARTYLTSFNETDGHLHWHCYPRFVCETEPWGPNLPDWAGPVPDGWDDHRVWSRLQRAATLLDRVATHPRCHE